MINSVRKAHFIGIGGIGMSALARVLIGSGVVVTGSDIAENKNTEALRRMGARIWVPHNAEKLPEDADIVVYSSAVPEDNEELRKAKTLGLRVLSRGELLALVAREKFSVLVAGSHGKTTTSAMIAKIAVDAGLSPTVIVGGRMVDFKSSNAHLGKGEIIIAETDESDGSFLLLEPSIGVVTNIDKEHLNFYGSFENLKKAFRRFLEKTKRKRVIFADDPVLSEVAEGLDCIRISLNSKKAEFFVSQVKLGENEASFTLFSDFGKLNVRLRLTGVHNVYNAALAAATALLMGIDKHQIEEALSSFSGVERRLHIRGEKNGVVFIDDYAHHPTEIKTTLKALRIRFPGKRIIAVFQPHRYSRLRYLWRDFTTSFSDADIIWVTDIYAAGEKENNVDLKEMLRLLSQNSGKDVFFVSHWQDMVYPLSKILEENDVVVTLGAGDIWKLCEKLLKAI